MKIIIYQNREVYKEESKIGNDSENKVETLEFEFPEEYADFTKYIEFQIKGGKYVDLIENNKYVITREVAKYGKIKAQIVLKKNTENDVMVFKSDIFTLNVSNSINASENLVNTVGVDLIEKIVTKNNEQDVRLDALEADNIINKSNISNIQTEQTNQNNRLDSLELDNTTNKTDILNIKQEQITQNTNIQELQTDNTSNKSKIADLETKNAEQDNKIVSLETKNTEQDTNIQKNTDDITEINAKDLNQDTSIEELQTKVKKLETEKSELQKEVESMRIPGEEVGNPIHLSDSSNLPCEIVPIGGAEQETGDVTDEEGNVIGASPSPDYPSEVVTVGQNVNLISNNPDDWEQGTIDGNSGTLTSSTTRIRTKGFIDIVQKQYYIKLQDTNCCILNIIFYANDDSCVGQYYNIDSTISGATSKALTFPEKCKKIKITLRKKDNTSNILPSEILSIKPKLEKGTVATPYSPYGQGSVEIEVCNKNFIKMSDSQQIKNNGITATKIEKGWNIQGTSTAFVALNLGEVIAKAGTHTFSTNFSKSSLGVYVRLRDKTTNAIVAEIGNNQVTSRTYTINTDINANFVINIPSGTTVDIQITETQFEKSPTKTNYIEHESYTKVLPIQKEFVKIGDVEDTFVKVDGKWYEKHCSPKIIFDGTENIERWTTKNNNYRFAISYNNLKNLSEIKCNIFKDVGFTKTYSENEGIASNDINSKVLIYCDEIKQYTIEQFKEWGISKKLYFYCLLETPELIPCTAEQESILNSFYTYKGVTNVSMSGIGTLKVKYKKDLETLINKLSATSVAE